MQFPPIGQSEQEQDTIDREDTPFGRVQLTHVSLNDGSVEGMAVSWIVRSFPCNIIRKPRRALTIPPISFTQFIELMETTMRSPWQFCAVWLSSSSP